MKTTILLFCLLGSTQSLPQLNPALGLSAAKLVPDQATLLNQQQPNQVFPSLSLIPLTQLLTLGSDLQQLNPATGMAPGTQTFPLNLGGLTIKQQLQSQVSSTTSHQITIKEYFLSGESLKKGKNFFRLLLNFTQTTCNVLPEVEQSLAIWFLLKLCENTLRKRGMLPHNLSRIHPPTLPLPIENDLFSARTLGVCLQISFIKSTPTWLRVNSRTSQPLVNFQLCTYYVILAKLLNHSVAYFLILKMGVKVEPTSRAVIRIKRLLPIIVAQLGAQGAILSSEELPMAPQIFAGLLIQPLFPGAILPTSLAGATPEVQEGILPAGQAGLNPAIQRTPEKHPSTSSDTDSVFGVTTPAGLQRGMRTTGETTTESPNDEPQNLLYVVLQPDTSNRLELAQ
ncbi:amelotin [Loxodonta africana]|uniref:amelotin n=1 Tax=Loxodonta africana TaxID=9785 RepID=UPI0030CBA4E2